MARWHMTFDLFYIKGQMVEVVSRLEIFLHYSECQSEMTDEVNQSNRK